MTNEECKYKILDLNLLHQNNKSYQKNIFLLQTLDLNLVFISLNYLFSLLSYLCFYIQ